MNFDDLITEALKEDIPSGDLTTGSLGIKEKFGRARLIAKEDLVLSGSEVFSEVVKKLSPSTAIKWYFKDGDLLLKSQTLALIEGNLIELIQAERVGLNFMNHLSGIATYTRCFVNQVAGTKTKILDTRKTLPLMRSLEKQAVRHGGGFNHRLNLSDAVLVKENHIQIAGSIKNAVELIRKKTSKPIEIETKTIEEVREAVSLKVARVMFDNMSNDLIRECMAIVPAGIETEASGNMSVDRVRSVAELGVDYISVGAITHSAPQADISLLFLWE